MCRKQNGFNYRNLTLGGHKKVVIKGKKNTSDAETVPIQRLLYALFILFPLITEVSVLKRKITKNEIETKKEI